MSCRVWELLHEPSQLAPHACSMLFAQRLSLLLTDTSPPSWLQSKYLPSWEKVRVQSASQVTLHLKYCTHLTCT